MDFTPLKKTIETKIKVKPHADTRETSNIIIKKKSSDLIIKDPLYDINAIKLLKEIDEDRQRLIKKQKLEYEN